MRSIGVGRRDRSRETVIGHNLCNGCRHAAGIPIAAIVSVGRFLPPSDRNKRVAGPGFIDLHRLEFRRSAYRVELRRLYHGQTLRHGVHIEIEILHAGRLAVGVVSLFGDSQHGIDGAVGGNDRKSVVVLKIENIHQSVAPGATARGRGSDALAAFAADRTGSGRAGLAPVDKGDALPGKGKGLFITARRQEHSRPSGLFRCDGGRFVVDFRTRNDTNQSKGNQYGGPRLFHCTCFLHGIII